MWYSRSPLVRGCGGSEFGPTSRIQRRHWYRVVVPRRVIDSRTANRLSDDHETQPRSALALATAVSQFGFTSDYVTLWNILFLSYLAQRKSHSEVFLLSIISARKQNFPFRTKHSTIDNRHRWPLPQVRKVCNVPLVSVESYIVPALNGDELITVTITLTALFGEWLSCGNNRTDCMVKFERLNGWQP